LALFALVDDDRRHGKLPVGACGHQCRRPKWRLFSGSKRVPLIVPKKPDDLIPLPTGIKTDLVHIVALMSLGATACEEA